MTTTEAWVMDLLRGFRYHPPEEEMVNLLKKQVEGQGSQAMPEIEHKPWDLPDDESIQLFLRFSKKMMQGMASQACHFIPDIDFYKYEPWELAGLMLPDSPYQTRMWLCFSRPDYKYANSPRCNRLTEKGFWKITGKPREIKSRQLSKSVTCNKRTLTFHLGRPSKSSRTGWVKHEYSLTSTVPGSNLSSLVLFRMKNKSPDYESDNKKQLDVSIYDKSADPAIGGSMASSSQGDQAFANHMIPEAEEHLLGSGNHNDGEPGGFVPSDLDDIIQGLCAQLGLDSPSPPEPPQPHQLPQLGNVPGTGDYLASNSDNQAAAILHMLTDEEELLAYKELERVLLCSGNPDDAEPGSCVSSDKLQELCAQQGEDLDSPVPPPGTPELGNAPDVYTDKCSSWPSSIRDNDSSLPNKNNDGDSGGFVPSDLDDIIQGLCAQLGLDSPSPPEPPRPHQLPQLGNVPGTGDYFASNSDNQAAAIHHMITDEEELLAYKELERVLLCSGNPDDAEPGSCVSSDMLQELCAQQGEDLDSPVPPPGPPELGNAQDNDSSLPNKNNIPTNYDSKPVRNTASNFENQTPYERSSEVYCQSEENLQSFYRSLELENYTLSSPISYLDLGDLLHANNYIGCNESPSAALFPQSY